MIRALILYFLSIRPTHGYNIQRFIEINGMDRWARIQSGSIYYALNKLEKEGFIYTLKEERNGARIRKIYAISDSGREELVRTLKQELLEPMSTLESDKYMISFMFNRLEKDVIISLLNQHINMLKERKGWWQKGKEIKVLDTTLKSEVLHFDVVISGLEYQIKWHETLIEEVDELIKFSDGVEKVIGQIDFGNLDEAEYSLECPDRITQLQKLTNEIVKDPNNLEKILPELVRLLKEK